MKDSLCAFQIGAGTLAVPEDWIVGAYPLVNPSVHGEFIPVEQLRGALLGDGELRLVTLPERSTGEGRIVLVLRDGDRRVGLRIDRILSGAVPEDALRPARSSLFRPGDLLRTPATTTSTHTDSGTTYLLGESDLGLIALDIRDVVEVVHIREMKSRRLVHERTIGFLNHRGPAVPVLALHENPAPAPDPSLVVLQAEGLAFAVPLHRVHALATEPRWSERSARVLKPTDAIPFGDLPEIRRGYDRIFPDQTDRQLIRTRGAEHTYLEFVLGDATMIPIIDVLSLEEVQLAPGRAAPTGGVGYQNVHGQDVPIYDGRALYGFPALATPTGRERVVVLRNGDHPFGVIVDEISNILRIDSASRLDFPRLMLDSFTPRYRDDVTEFFQALDQRHERTLNMKVLTFAHLRAGSP